jgi:hypothetical protein
MLDLGSSSKTVCDGLVLHNAMVVLRELAKNPDNTIAQEALTLVEKLIGGEK